MYFMGVVTTTAHKKFFPLWRLDDVPIENRGETRTLTATVDGVRVMAHVWNDQGKTPTGKLTGKRKMIVSTHGSTAAREPRRRKRYKNIADGTHSTYTKEVPRSKLVQDYFDAAPAIDVHKHYRQSGLALEEARGTKTWRCWVRAFTDVLGIVHTNSYLAYFQFHPNGKNRTFADFTHDLAYELLTDYFDRSTLAVVLVVDVAECTFVTVLAVGGNDNPQHRASFQAPRLAGTLPRR